MKQARPTKHRAVVWAGALATVGVAVTGAGELMLHYNPDGFVEAARFGFLHDVSAPRLLWGHFLSVLFVPSYLLGYWHLAQGLRPLPDWMRLAWLGLADFTFVIAAIWIGSRAMLARIVQARTTPSAEGLVDALIADYHLYVESLIWIVRIGVVLISVVFATAVARRRTAYPRWMALANPALILALVFTTLVVWPPLGYWLVPAAMNVTHVFVFGLSTAWTWRGPTVPAAR